MWYILGGNINDVQSSAVFSIDLEVMVCKRFPEARNGPGPIDAHVAVLIPGETHRVLVFGGYSGAQKSSRLFEYTIATNSWQEVKVSGKKPLPRSGHSAVFYEGAMYVHGGAGEDGESLADTWKYDAATHVWTELTCHMTAEEEQPRPRAGHTAVVHADHMYVFGGSHGITQETNDFYALDLKTETWSIVHPAEKLNRCDEQLSPVSAVKAIRMRENMKRSKAPDASPMLKGLRPDFFKMMQDSRLDSPRRRRKKSIEGSPTISPRNNPLYKTTRQLSCVPERELRLSDEQLSPIVLTMTHSLVMRATFSNKKRSPKTERVEQTTGRVIGSFPCGRDGHIAQIHGGKLYVFGGDRYKMAYNDLYSFSFT
jgi:N-acetylneuraminic acid mutarotase